MIGSKTLVYCIMICVILSCLNTPVIAKKPVQPDINYILDTKKEKTIQGLESLSVPQAFDRLMSVDILTNEKFLNKAVYYAFQHRQKAAVAFALNAMKQQTYQQSEDGEVISRGIAVYVSSKVFEMFPDEAIDPLLQLYQNGDPITRANIVRAGAIVNHQSIRQLLLIALDDKIFFEEEEEEEKERIESIGNPMRVCDNAYNQIVLKYKVKSVLRTISPGHKVETRDYHIEKLKQILSNQKFQ
ncbi:MAG: hypothetical protein LWX54_12100 [Deltaproteobacteria bacterium]|nr:hypothetical protein [Deltaproteobacteria bacterium]